MRIITLNMNGIRSASNKGVFSWLDSQDADFICVQEVKAHESDLTQDMKQYGDYTSYFSFAEKKGYSGTAIFSKIEPVSVSYDFSDKVVKKYHLIDKQDRDSAVDDLRKLHSGNICRVEREHQEITADRRRAATKHNDPVDHLLASVEAIRGRVIAADKATAALRPLDIDLVRNVAGDPHQKDQDDANREWEA